jgi:hypothetical protein
MDAAEPVSDSVIRLRVRNQLTQRVDFVVEPYGYVFTMEPKAIFEVVAEGPSGDAIDMVVDAESIKVWLGSGALLTALYRDGINLLADTEELPRVPKYPTPPQ